MELHAMREPELRAWYADGIIRDFPPQERKPLEDILALWAAGSYEVWGLYDSAELAGYAAFWSRPGVDFVLLDYLGVASERRNSGLGARLLHRTLALYGDRSGVIAEAEAPCLEAGRPEDSLRRRRIGFYLRNGFTDTYEMAGCGLRLQGLVWGESAGDLEELMAAHRAIYGPGRTDILMPLAPGQEPPPGLFQ